MPGDFYVVRYGAPVSYPRVKSEPLLLIAVFFFTSVLSVVTGSTSLITVPAMISLGIEAHVAIATNMLALTFMSVGGSLPFMGKGVLRRSGLRISILLTVIGSWLGALLLPFQQPTSTYGTGRVPF